MNRPLVFASVGTDHHPFHRMVDWLDRLAVRHGSDLHVVVQHGHSRAPRVAEGHEFLSYDKLVHLIEDADVVVCHGGPGTIMDARRAGHVPVCIGRDPGLGEHVDDHQRRFLRKVSETGAIHRVPEEEQFHNLVDRLLRERARPETVPFIPQQRQASGVPLLAQNLDGMLARTRSERPSRIGTVRDYLRARPS